MSHLTVALFGTGVGESVAVQLDDSKWMIVDSCRHPTTNAPCALEYLKSIGVDVTMSVSLIVLSHWHDDHIGGARDLVSECTSATIVFSQALKSEEFGELLAVYGDGGDSEIIQSRGLKEFRGIVDTLRLRISPSSPTPFKLGKADSIIFNSDSCEVWCLSPSDQAIISATASFREAAPKYMRQRIALHTTQPNHNSIALWVHWKKTGHNILLGSDLETTPSQVNIGWDGVLQTVAIRDRKAQIIKIPHHGSVTGHHPRVWDRHLTSMPFGILTTFNRGESLPKESDIVRLKRLCATIAATTQPKSAPTKREPTVERTIREAVITRTVIRRTHGQVNLQLQPDGGLTHQLFGHALNL